MAQVQGRRLPEAVMNRGVPLSRLECFDTKQLRAADFQAPEPFPWLS